VAAMPSGGRIKRLSVCGGIATAALGAAATGADASLTAGGIGLRVVDDRAPDVAVGGFRSPGSDFNSTTHRYDLPMPLEVRANDGGSGLRRAEVYVDGGLATGKEIGGDACDGTSGELSPGSAPVDLPLDGACASARVPLPLTTTAFANGPHTFEVRVSDWAGNVGVWRPTEPWSILNNPDLGSPTQTLSIGSSGVDQPPAPPNPRSGGGVGGAQSSSCRSPRLSVSLDSRPLRISKGRPVLLAGKRYRFEGRLTCVVNGKRRSAPKRTRIEILNKVGRKTVKKPVTRLRAGGKLNAVLKTPNQSGSRTLIFRYRNSSGQRSQVSIRVTIIKKTSTR
jgi:hypothetical protein